MNILWLLFNFLSFSTCYKKEKVQLWKDNKIKKKIKCMWVFLCWERAGLRWRLLRDFEFYSFVLCCDLLQRVSPEMLIIMVVSSYVHRLIGKWLISPLVSCFILLSLTWYDQPCLPLCSNLHWLEFKMLAVLLICLEGILVQWSALRAYYF